MLHHNNAQELDYNKSFPFDIIRYREVDNYTDQQIRAIVDTVWLSLPFHTNSKTTDKNKYREMVKNYVLNLIKSYQSNYCIRVSRNRNDHHYEERYSHIFTTPTIVIKTMDSLHDNDWIDLHIGFFDKQRNSGKQTRLEPSQKFIDLVENNLNTNGVSGNKKIRFIKDNAKEVIQLRHKIDDNKFRLVPYKDTPKTMRMRSRLKMYNDFMRNPFKALTIVTLSRKELTEMNQDHRDTFNNYMLNGSIVFCDRKMRKGSKVVKEKKIFTGNPIKNIPATNSSMAIQYTPSGNEEYTRSGNNPTTGISVQGKHYFDKPFATTTTNNHNTINSTNNHRKEKEKDRREDIPITKTLAHETTQLPVDIVDVSYQDNDRGNEYYSIDEVLNDYPNSRKFWFRIVPQDMFRAFSDTSKRFDHHGRFYGDVVQNLPKWMRTKITMGHKEVVECDYTSIHPTMLYVMAGAVPSENIYMINKSTDPELRKEYKTVLLVSINHKNPKTMWSAVSSHFRDEFGYKAGDKRLTKKYIMGIYDRLLKHNQPIKKYMNKGVAMRLMRKDSEIADRILYEFISNEIPIRCIHDSFIVLAEYEAELKTLMVEYFQEVMNTDYVIGITTETACSKRSGEVVNEPVKHPEVDQVVVDTEEDFGDNVKYFTDLEEEDDDDIEFNFDDFSGIYGKYSENQFEGIIT